MRGLLFGFRARQVAELSCKRDMQWVKAAKVKESPFPKLSSVNTNQSLLNMLQRRRGSVRALGLHGLDLFSLVPDSTLPRFVNRKLVNSYQLGFLIMFLLSLNCFFQII